MTDEIFTTLKTLILEKTGIPEFDADTAGRRGFFEDPEQIRREMPLAELGLDSLAITALSVALEDRFHITLSPMLMFEVFTIGDFVDRIAAEVAGIPEP